MLVCLGRPIVDSSKNSYKRFPFFKLNSKLSIWFDSKRYEALNYNLGFPPDSEWPIQ